MARLGNALFEFEDGLCAAIQLQYPDRIRMLADREREMFDTSLSSPKIWRAANQASGVECVKILLNQTRIMPPQLMSLLRADDFFVADTEILRILLLQFPDLVNDRTAISTQLNAAMDGVNIAIVRVYLDYGVKDFDISDSRLEYLVSSWDHNWILELLEAKCSRIRERIVKSDNHDSWRAPDGNSCTCIPLPQVVFRASRSS